LIVDPARAINHIVFGYGSSRLTLCRCTIASDIANDRQPTRRFHVAGSAVFSGSLAASARQKDLLKGEGGERQFDVMTIGAGFTSPFSSRGKHVPARPNSRVRNVWTCRSKEQASSRSTS
jgi:hypothetical protein